MWGSGSFVIENLRNLREPVSGAHHHHAAADAYSKVRIQVMLFRFRILSSLTPSNQRSKRKTQDVANVWF